ncbi:MAG: formylglycine-generating enzyme family protein, partial [Pseudomonadota bacterium]
MSRASVKAYRHLASLLEELGQRERPPPPGSPWREHPPQVFPAPWASSWGEDEFGVWCGFSVGGVEQRMRWIPPGVAQVGSPDDEPERYGDEVRYERAVDGFWMAETACSQDLWRAVVGDDPSEFKQGDHPVESVSWDDVQKRFLPMVTQQLPGARLPTEVEWEYACRAGTVSPFWWGRVLSPGLANYDGNYPYDGGKKGEYRQRTRSVLKGLPNPWGLYQVHGNVFEWCQDEWQDDPRQPPVGAGG